MESLRCGLRESGAGVSKPARPRTRGMASPARSIRRSFGKTAMAWAALAFALLFPPHSALASPGLIREPLGEGIWLFRAPSELDLWTSSNSLVIVNSDDVVVFDNNARPSTTRLLIAEIRKLTPKPVTVLINSHWHQDHWSGNAEFAKAWPGLRIIATRQTREFMARMGPGYFADQIARNIPRLRTELDREILSGREADGTALEPAERASKEAEIEQIGAFAEETRNSPRVLPNLVFDHDLVFWSGTREFRVLEETGDASASTVLFLPAERVLATGDVLVMPENGMGPPPWSTNSNAVAAWLESLRALCALDARIIVPGQGPAQHDDAYLKLTTDLYSAIVDQVHGALRRGLFRLDDVRASMDLEAIGRRYFPESQQASPAFNRLADDLVRRAFQEALDSAGRASASQ